MEIKLSTSYVDVANHVDAEDGETITLDDDVAERLIERGSATPVGGPPAAKRTTRTRPAPEKRG